MFRGITAINLDAKGRLAVPTRYREQLQSLCNGHLIVTIDTESPCLLLYSLPEWEIIEAKVQALPSFNQAARRIQRLLIGHATEIEVDTIGRILVPPLLREYANLDKKVVLVGQGKKFEIWDDEKWQLDRKRWLEEASSHSEDIPEDMKTLSL